MIDRIVSLIKSESFTQLLKYLVVGGSITSLYLGGVLAGSLWTDFPPILINSFFYIVSAIVGYLLNYYWAFKADGQHLTTLLKYTLIASTGIILNAVYVWALLKTLPAPLVVISFSFAAIWPIVSFFAQKYFVYSNNTPFFSGDNK